MSVFIKLDYRKFGIDSGKLSKLIVEKVGDVWEYPIVKKSGVKPKMYYVYLTRKFKEWKKIGKSNVRIGSGLVIVLPDAVITERPDTESPFWKIFVNNEKAEKILREAGFDVDIYGFWYVPDEWVFEIIERRVWK